MDLISLTNNDLKAIIHKGELVSFSFKGKEIFHGAAKPDKMKDKQDFLGWNHSELMMFPVVGPVKDFKLFLEENWVSHDQHGISRLLDFFHKENSSVHAVFYQKHDGILEYPNPKFKTGGSNPEKIHWPFAYKIEKQFKLKEDKLIVTFTIINDHDKEMPYMFGWHPAFRVYGKPKDNIFTISDKKYNLNDVVQKSKSENALKIKKAEIVIFENKKIGIKIEISAENFGSFMIWSPDNDAGMVCIEPATHLPVHPKKQTYFSKGTFEMLKPNEKKTYSVTIKVS